MRLHGQETWKILKKGLWQVWVLGVHMIAEKLLAV